jgi:RNase P subunit RPR2
MESRLITEELMADNRRRDAEADSDAEVLRQVRTCPKCGSIDRYTQRRVS